MKKRIVATALAMIVLSALLILPAGAVGEKSYLPVLQNMIFQVAKASKVNPNVVYDEYCYPEGGSGAFCDLNGDGIQELVAVRWGEYPDNNGLLALHTALYTKAADGTPVLAVDEILYVAAGQPDGFASVVKKGGATYFLISSGGGDDEFYTQTYSLYTLNGINATVSESAEMRITDSDCIYTFNGKTVSEDEFIAWLTPFNGNESVLFYGINSKGVTGLSTLLAQVEALADGPTSEQPSAASNPQPQQPVSSGPVTPGMGHVAVSLNGRVSNLNSYTLTENGGSTTYVKLRDIAALLNGTGNQFNVDWRDHTIYVTSSSPYTTQNGTELKAISGTDGSYQRNTAPVIFDGTTKALDGIVITDSEGGWHTFFKLRDVGKLLEFTVDWTAERGIYIETK